MSLSFAGLKNWYATSRKLKLTQKIFFVQQLEVMVRTGISMSVALKTLAAQTDGKQFKAILTDLQAEVDKGNALAKGLEKHTHAFGELFINMVRAGEASGKLEEVLKQLFIQMKKDSEILAKVRSAMIYPIIVVMMMVGVAIMVTVYVIPQISGIFKELEVPLPLATRVLIAISDITLQYGIFIALGLLVLGIGVTRIISLPRGKRHFHSLLLKTPIFGRIIKKINLARFCRTLSSLLKTDIPIVQSFEITARVLGNRIYREALTLTQEQIKKGVGIRDSLNAHPALFPPVVLQMIAVGEETGTLDDILEESATFYEEDVRQTMTDLPTIVEPLLMVVLGLGVAGMAVAVIMPMYSLSQQI